MNKILKNIKVLAMDVDGVLTDGRIVYDGMGRELKFFDVQDGCGINRIRKAGLKTAVISARSCRAVRARTDDLKIDAVYLDAYPKVGAYEDMLKKFGVTDAQVCFIGDDLPDIAILKRVGLAVAVANASADVKRQAHFVTKKKGGRGAVREVAERVLKAQGKWDPQ